jgi:hypothetical protein
MHNTCFLLIACFKIRPTSSESQDSKAFQRNFLFKNIFQIILKG